MIRKTFTLIASLALVILRPSANAQTMVAQDDCEAYSGGNYTDENHGSGFSGAFQFRAFGTDDQGGEFIETGSRKISGNQSFGLYANTSGSGKAVSRSFTGVLSGLHRISFRVRFDLNTGIGMSAGFVICNTDVGSQSMWNTGQRLFLGISGDGLWKYDDGTLKTVTLGGGNFSCIGGDIYLVELDFNATAGDTYAFRITNETSSSVSDIMSGTLSGTSGSGILSIGFGNGVLGNSQNLIFDDIVVTQNPANPLPIELVSFTASVRTEGVLLQWETASESNNSHFEVETSRDLRNWEIVGRVQGAGTALESTQYHLLDPSPQPGPNYYRLRQVDFDGTSWHSAIVVVDWTGNGRFEVFPNPFGGAIGIRIADQDEAMPSIAELMDVNGRVHARWVPEPESLQEVQAAPGVYLLRISDGNGRILHLQKVVKF